VIEPAAEDRADVAPEAHAMNPVKVLALAEHLGDGPLPRVVVLGCEPGVLPRHDDDVTVGLSEPVRAAVPGAVRLLHTLVPLLLADPQAPLTGVADAPVAHPSSS
jgi:hydrogenase maturation protease